MEMNIFVGNLGPDVTEADLAELFKPFGQVASVQLVRELDLQVPQVQIEGRIVQADTNFSRSLGIQWGIQNQNTLGPQGNNVANFKGGNFGAFGNHASDFLVNLPATVAGLEAVPAGGAT